MKYSEIKSIIDSFLENTLEIPKENIFPNALLKDDIGLSSMDGIEIRLFLEKDFGIKVNRDEMLEIKTLADLYSLIQDKTK